MSMKFTKTQWLILLGLATMNIILISLGVGFLIGSLGQSKETKLHNQPLSNGNEQQAVPVLPTNTPFAPTILSPEWTKTPTPFLTLTKPPSPTPLPTTPPPSPTLTKPPTPTPLSTTPPSPIPSPTKRRTPTPLPTEIPPTYDPCGITVVLVTNVEKGVKFEMEGQVAENFEPYKYRFTHVCPGFKTVTYYYPFAQQATFYVEDGYIEEDFALYLEFQGGCFNCP